MFWMINFQSKINESREKLAKIENDFKKELTCSICANFLNKCITLAPCQHNFCSFCLFDHLKLSSRCPLCRVEAISVTTNPVLSNLVQLVVDHFSPESKSQEERKELEQRNLAGVIVRNNEGVEIGSYINGKKDRQGKMIFKDGSIYEGSWRNNKAEGKGMMAFKNGDQYYGNWMNDRYHGMGKYFWKNCEEYEGNFQNCMRTGSGTMKYSDGRVYQGEWKNNKREGNGTLTLANGDKYEGKWMNDVLQPEVKIEYSNGENHEGEINVGNLKKQGKGTLISKNGDSYEGYWENDKEHGNGKRVSQDGKVKDEGIWQEGSLWTYGRKFLKRGRKWKKQKETKQSR